MNGRIPRELQELLRELLIVERNEPNISKAKNSTWRIRPGLKNAFDRANTKGWDEFKKQSEEFIRRLKGNKGESGPVDLRLKTNETVSVDTSLPFDELVSINKSATNPLEAIEIKTTDEKSIPLLRFEKEGQFSKPKSAKTIVASGQFNGFLAEWAVAWCIDNEKPATTESIETYFDTTVSVKDSRLSPYLNGDGAILDPKARQVARENFVEMVMKSFDPFKQAGLPTKLGIGLEPDHRDPTATVDVKFTSNETNYTVHVKFNEQKRIAGIQSFETSTFAPTAPTGQTFDNKGFKNVINDLGASVKDIAVDVDGLRKTFFEKIEGNLSTMATRVKEIIFGRELTDLDTSNDAPAFNCIVNYSKKNIPQVTVLSSPGTGADKSGAINPRRVTFTIEPDYSGKTIYFFTVKATVDGTTIPNVMKIELRDDRVPQLHMSSNWKRFTGALQNMSQQVTNESITETLSLLNELFAEAKNNSHPSAYKAPQGSERDKQLDQTQADLKSGDPERIQRAYRRRERMEKQARSQPGWKNRPRQDTQSESHEPSQESQLFEAMQTLLEALSKKLKATLRKKALKRGLTPGSVESEYKKGLAAYASSGSRPGMTAHQWSMARVNAATPSKKWATVKRSKAKKKK